MRRLAAEAGLDNLPELNNRAQKIVHDHWPLVQKVARRLLYRGQLDGATVDEIMTQTVSEKGEVE